MAQKTFAIELNEQIKQNIDDATESYKNLVNKEPARLWIQVRTEEQMKLLENLAEWLKPFGLIKIEPIQLVKDGPKQTKLRFFSKQDKDQAENLLKTLTKIFPKLELQDLSDQYGDMGWLQAGHYELWLAPDVKNITQPASPLPATP
jgi:hypothetical protein